MTPTEVRDFLVGLAPELANLAVLFHSALPPKLPRSQTYAGATDPVMDLIFADQLPPGPRRPALLLNDGELAKEVDDLVSKGGFDRAEAEAWTFGRVALHEAAHVLRRPFPFFDPPPAEGSVMSPLFMTVVLSSSVKLLDPADHLPRWWGHDAPWLRLVCHLAHRSRRRGIGISPNAIVDGWEWYGLSVPERYARALGDECERLALQPFETIKALPLPPAFAELWRQDTEVIPEVVEAASC